MDVFRLGQILQAVPPEVAELDPGGDLALGQGSSRLAHQDLAAVRGPGDPGRPMNVDPDVVVRTQKPALAGVHAHAHTDGMREPVIGERSLDAGGSLERVAWAAEHDEEGVTLRPHLDPIVLGDSVANDLSLLFQEVGVALAGFLQEFRRPLDVRE